MNLKKNALRIALLLVTSMVTNVSIASAEETTADVNPINVVVGDAEVGAVDHTEGIVSEALTDRDLVVEIGSASPTKKNSYTKAELRLMSAIIFCESNVEPYAGKLAVGIVVMNRVESKAFPNTIKNVIYQRRQFSPVHNGALKKA